MMMNMLVLEVLKLVLDFSESFLEIRVVNFFTLLFNADVGRFVNDVFQVGTGIVFSLFTYHYKSFVLYFVLFLVEMELEDTETVC